MLRIIKNLIKKLPHPLFLRAYLAWYCLRDLRRYRKVRRSLGIALLHQVDLSTYKKSDTIFLLGSGPSINHISPDRWACIAQHDSIGFNFWVLHPFVPTLYSFEAIDHVRRPDVHAAFRAAIERRAADYREVPKIVTELKHAAAQKLLELPADFRQNLYTVYSI